MHLLKHLSIEPVPVFIPANPPIPNGEPIDAEIEPFIVYDRVIVPVLFPTKPPISELPEAFPVTFPSA